jgi:hypothetical protein
MTVDQHAPFDAELADALAKPLPKWLPSVDIDPNWRIATGEFPTLTDPALLDREEES